MHTEREGYQQYRLFSHSSPRTEHHSDQHDKTKTGGGSTAWVNSRQSPLSRPWLKEVGTVPSTTIEREKIN